MGTRLSIFDPFHAPSDEVKLPPTPSLDEANGVSPDDVNFASRDGVQPIAV